MKSYDSTSDTLEHIGKVASRMEEVCDNLHHRAGVHDDSKLENPEKEAFDTLTPRLKGLTYGSEEYRASLKELKLAIVHHYAANSHHPEHHENGIDGMSLMDLVEMLCDWKAAGERHADGDMKRSLELNRPRFNISPQLQSVLINTARELKWI